MTPMKPIRATASEAKEIKFLSGKLARMCLLELAQSMRMAPISGAATMADQFIFSVAEIDADHAHDYFSAVLATLKTKGAEREKAETRRQQAFERLVLAYQARTAQAEGSA